MSATKISPELRKFLREWLAWAEAGGPRHEVFSRSRGLCGCALVYGYYAEICYQIRSEMRDIFNCSYPFGGSSTFFADEMNRTMHLNQLRLAWVRNTLGLPQPQKKAVRGKAVRGKVGAK